MLLHQLAGSGLPFQLVSAFGGSAVFGRVGRSAATVAIAGVLCFAVPISAQALVNPVPLGEFVLGAVEAAAPVEAGSGVVGPEGSLLATTAVALGALAYDTRDTWMPWVSGLFGQGGSGQSGGVSAVEYTWSLSVDAGQNVIAHFIPSTATYAIYYNRVTQCRDSFGNLSTIAPGGSAGFQFSAPGDVVIATCGAGLTVVSSTVASNDWDNHGAPTLTWGAPFDPHTQATYRVDASCRKTDGTVETISATTIAPGNPPTPVDGVGGGGLLVPSCAGAFAGSHAEGLTVNGGQTGSPLHELSHQLFPQTSTLYPNCVGAGAACTYVVTYNGAPCVVGQAECVAWEHSRLAVGDAPYGCLFGAYVMTLAQCAIDERVYEPGGTTLTKLNTDGNPNTYDAPAPAWAPTPAPVGGPGGDPAPVTGPQNNPTSTQTSNTDCWPSGAAAWNPADWVLTPVKCALSWAFVPRASVLAADAAGASTDLSTAGIAPIAGAVGANFALIGQGTGCDGPGVTFAAVGVTKALHPFSACTSPMSTLATISYALSTVGIVGVGGFAALRAVGAGFGFNVSMGRGKVEGS